MKAMILLLTFLFIGSVQCFSQDQDYEKKNYYELKGRANLYEVNDRYEIEADTIFYTGSGFLINPEWDEVSIQGKIYVILTYPPFEHGVQLPSENSEELLAETKPVHFPLKGLNDRTLCMLKDDFDKIQKDAIYSVSFWKGRNYQFTTGQLTLPFKLRPKIGDKKFQMTTDVTIGAYGGIRKRLSRRNPYYLTIPLVLGLSFININENSTSTTGTADGKSGITPGFTWSTGLVLQLNRLNAGFVFGKDYASGYADDWIYHNKTWYSFAIGYSFLK